MTLLSIQNVSKTYGPLTALNNVSFEIAPRRCMGLIGPNGSGKSTLLKCIAGAHFPTSGRILLGDRDVTSMTPAERSLEGLSLKFQITSIYPKLSVYDNLLLAMQAGSPMMKLVFSRSAANLQHSVEAALTQYFLSDMRHEQAGRLSHGQQQWLEIAMAMSRKPSVLLLDEPTAGMSPQERAATGKLFSAVKHETAIIIVEHDLDFIREVADCLSVLDQGQLIASGPIDQVQNDARVREAYLNYA